MIHKITKTENYLLIVDDSDIKEGDFYLRYNNSVLRCTQLKESFNEGLNRNEIIILANGCGDPYERSRDYLKKIIAYLPLNNSPVLQGVDLLPPLEQEDDVEKLVDETYPETYYSGIYVDGWLKAGFIKGYNKAKEKYKWSDEDVVRIVEKSRETGLTAEFLLLSLSQPKMPIGFEQGNTVDGKTYTSVTRRHDGFTLWVGKYIY